MILFALLGVIFQSLAPFYPADRVPSCVYQEGIQPSFGDQPTIHKTIKLGAHWVSSDVYATDKANPPGRVQVFGTGVVNPQKVGDYVITYLASDFVGNTTRQQVVYHVRP